MCVNTSRRFCVLLALGLGGCAGEASSGEPMLAEIPVSSKSVAPPGTVQADWDAESVDDETKSTHLWIVNRALGLLAERSDLPQAAAAVTLLGAADCQPSWHQGLADADFKAAYNGAHWDVAVGASTASLTSPASTWDSHFWDPDTGHNYKGHSTPAAYGQALPHLGHARKSSSNAPAPATRSGCALHYFTDLTQPMHASNYTAKNWPVEAALRLRDLRDGAAVALRRERRGAAPPPAMPRRSCWQRRTRPRRAGPTLEAAIAAAYGARCGKFSSYWTDHTNCWEGDAAVDAQLGSDLAAAQLATASYLYSAALP